jgi:hypothetical protein
VKCFGQEISGDVDATREAVGEYLSEHRWSVIRVTTPAALAVAAVSAAAAPILSPIAGAGIVGLAVSALLVKQRPNHSMPQPHHILELEKALGSDGPSGIERGFRKLFPRWE